MPTEKRGEIGQVKPSGWQTVRYDGLVDGNYLYNRCHLIGYQLSGENANTSNVIGDRALQSADYVVKESRRALEKALAGKSRPRQFTNRNQWAAPRALYRAGHKKAIEEQEKNMKAALFDAMEQYGITKFESDVLNLTYVAPTVSHSIDSAKLKKKYPDAAADCAKDTPKAGYVRITLKGANAK